MGAPSSGPGETPGSHHQVLATGCLPDDLLQLLYVKQLSPSDAASSKQIKLPKNEVKAFLGDLRHKQRCMVVVVDHMLVCWEFLCTCYGCQYALSRVAAFANTYQLRAGQFIMFYQDTLHRLRLLVTNKLPPELLHQRPVGGGAALVSTTHPQVGPLLYPSNTTQEQHPAAITSTAAAAAAAAGSSGFVLPHLLSLGPTSARPGRAARTSTEVPASNPTQGGVFRAASVSAFQAREQAEEDENISQTSNADSSSDNWQHQQQQRQQQRRWRAGPSGSNTRELLRQGSIASHPNSTSTAAMAAAAAAAATVANAAATAAAAAAAAGAAVAGAQQQAAAFDCGLSSLLTNALQSGMLFGASLQQQQQLLFTFGAAAAPDSSQQPCWFDSTTTTHTAGIDTTAATMHSSEKAAAAASGPLGRTAAGCSISTAAAAAWNSDHISSLDHSAAGSWVDETAALLHPYSYAAQPSAAAGCSRRMLQHRLLGKRAKASAEAALPVQPTHSMGDTAFTAAGTTDFSVTAAAAEAMGSTTTGLSARAAAAAGAGLSNHHTMPSQGSTRTPAGARAAGSHSILWSDSATAAAPPPAAAAAAATVAAVSAPDLTPPKAAFVMDLSPACSVAPARAAAAKDMACLQPFGEVTDVCGLEAPAADALNPDAAAAAAAVGAVSVPDKGFGSLAGFCGFGSFGACGSDSSKLCPPIFQPPAATVTAAGAAVLAAAAAAGQTTGTATTAAARHGSRPTAGAPAAAGGNDSTSNAVGGGSGAAAAATLKLPSLDDILLLHHMREQQRKQQRQQQLALLQSCFLNSYATLRGGNKRTATTTSSSSSTSAGSTLSGTLGTSATFGGGTFPAAVSAVLPGSDNSTGTGGTLSTPALLPLFKVPAPRTSYTGSLAGSTSTVATLVQDAAMFGAAGYHGHNYSRGLGGGGAGSSSQQQQQQQQQRCAGQQYSRQQYGGQQQGGAGTEGVLLAHATLLQLLAGSAAAAATQAAPSDAACVAADCTAAAAVAVTDTSTQQGHVTVGTAHCAAPAAAADATVGTAGPVDAQTDVRTACAKLTQQQEQAAVNTAAAGGTHTSQVPAATPHAAGGRKPGACNASSPASSTCPKLDQQQQQEQQELQQQQQQQEQKPAEGVNRCTTTHKALADVTTRTVNGGVQGLSPGGPGNPKSALLPSKLRPPLAPTTATSTKQQQRQLGQLLGVQKGRQQVSCAGVSAVTAQTSAGAAAQPAGSNTPAAAAAVTQQPAACRVARAPAAAATVPAAAQIGSAAGLSPLSDEWSAASGLMLLLQS